MTLIIHPFKHFKCTSNVLCMRFITIVKGDLLEKLEKGVDMYKKLEQDNRLLSNLLNDNG